MEGKIDKNGKKSKDLTFDELKELFKTKQINQKSFICMIKSRFIDELNKETSFLDCYDDVTINERIWYIVNDVHDVVKCKYCDNKATFIGHVNKGYRDICKSKECRTKQLSDSHEGQTIISENRDAKFIEEQANVTYVDDEVIKSLLKYDKYLDIMTNPLIIDYIDNRFDDSYNRLETLQRIRMGVYVKPKCPMCGKPVTWIGRKRALYTTYCSDLRCSANSPIHRKNVSETYKANRELLDLYGSSKEEKDVEQMLITLGYKIETQYVSDLYPYKCDFYLPDYDLYIEYNRSHFHNYRAYFGTQKDLEELEYFKKKSDEKKKEFGKDYDSHYDNIIYTWTITDVNKRNCAEKNHLNYLELYYYPTPTQLKRQIDDYLQARALNTSYFGVSAHEIPQLMKYANSPIERRRMLQNASERTGKKECDLTHADIFNDK